MCFGFEVFLTQTLPPANTLVYPTHFLGGLDGFVPLRLLFARRVAMDDSELMQVCTVGGNAVSAFLSWRLQATNACDVTLVWKSGFESVYQYGISFK